MLFRRMRASEHRSISSPVGISRLRSGHSPQNMATVRHIALNLLRWAKDKHSLKIRRKSAGWKTDCLEIIIR